MRALFIMHYFEMGTMAYNAYIWYIMFYKVHLWTEVFWISYIKWYKFYNNNLSVVSVSKQGGRCNSWTPKHEDWGSRVSSTLKEEESFLNKTMSRQNGNRRRNNKRVYKYLLKSLAHEIVLRHEKIICMVHLCWNVFQ